MKLYTGNGDQGHSDLLTEQGLAKDHIIFETIGTVDELNAAIGVVLAEQKLEGSVRGCLEDLQSDLFALGAHLAGAEALSLKLMQVAVLERWLDQWTDALPPLKNFVLPAGSTAVAMLHLCRTITRRLERRLVSAGHVQHVPPVNRLSDFLFAAARLQASHEGVPEEIWKS